jgi:FlaG/FlaF family flagellin (archaellin)
VDDISGHKGVTAIVEMVIIVAIAISATGLFYTGITKISQEAGKKRRTRPQAQ